MFSMPEAGKQNSSVSGPGSWIGIEDGRLASAEVMLKVWQYAYTYVQYKLYAYVPPGCASWAVDQQDIRLINRRLSGCFTQRASTIRLINRACSISLVTRPLFVHKNYNLFREADNGQSERTRKQKLGIPSVV